MLARAAVLCRRTGEFRPLLQTLFFTALARGDTGDFAGALRALDSARRLIDAENLGFYRAGIETTSSWIWQELGQVDRAREHAVLGVELAHRGGGALELEQELHALLAMADCDLLLGRPDDAAAAVETATPDAGAVAAVPAAGGHAAGGDAGPLGPRRRRSGCWCWPAAAPRRSTRRSP